MASLPQNAEEESSLIGKLSILKEPQLQLRLTLSASPIRCVNAEIAVSYLPILPPIWIAVPADIALYP